MTAIKGTTIKAELRRLQAQMMQRALLLVASILLAAPVWAVEVGEPMPAFQQPGLGHGKMLNSNYFAGKVLYLDFWASWCGPCRISLPTMDKLYREFNDQGFEVVAVNVDKNLNDAKRFLKQHPVSYYLVTDDGSLPRRYGVKGMPTAYLIDRQGRVRRIHEGFRPGDEQSLRLQIEYLLNETSGVSAVQ